MGGIKAGLEGNREKDGAAMALLTLNNLQQK
jgi:hypothetical protein